MTFVIAEPCIDVKDRACVDECPVDCIYEGGRMLYIQPDECIDCAACEPVCPVDAIFAEDEVPAEWKSFQAINAEWFEQTGLGRRAAPSRSAREPTIIRRSPAGKAPDRSPLRGAPRTS